MTTTAGLKASAEARDPKPPFGATADVSRWLAGFTLEQVPDRVRTRAMHLLLDGIGCALMGAQLPWSRTAVDAVTAFEGRGNATLVGTGRTTSAPAAALLNGTFIQGFELDDFHPLAPLHSNALMLPALLATVGCLERVSGETLLRGAIAGYELGPRVGLSLHGSEMLTRGWHSGSVFGTLASAAAAGTLLGLDAATFEDALGLAATQSCGLMGAQYEAMCKRMHHGIASRNGLYAAFLARGGYTGIKQVFELPYGGFLSTFGEGHGPDASQLTSGLGTRWETERIVVKPYAAMGGLHASLDALFEIARERPLRPEDVAQIDVDLSEAVYHHGWWKPVRPLTATGAQMNVAYALAVAAIDGEALIHQFAPSRIDRDDVWTLIPKITAHHDPAFDAAGAVGRGRTRLRVRFTDGTTLEREKVAARSALEPLPNDAVVAKYRSLTRGVLDPARQQAVETLVLSLDRALDVRPLVEALAAEVVSPFELP
jgi:aconitate decarboxylase